MPHRSLTLLCLLLLCAVALPARGQATDTKARLIAESGAADFSKVRELRFTFNVSRKDQPTVSRSFVWTPATQEVRVRAVDQDGKPFALSYHRDQVKPDSPADIVQADKWFINDSFWLIMPLHLSWNQDVLLEDQGMSAVPIGEGQARKIVVTYPASGGGYTPGDAYDLYVDPRTFLVQQWVFRRGNAAEPTLVTTFEDYRQVGPLRVAMDHHNADKTFRLWFSDVSVVLSNGKEVKPKALKSR